MEKETPLLVVGHWSLVIGLVFLLPLFFLPLTTNFYQLNKFALLSIITFFLLLLWGLRISAEKKVIIQKNLLNLPLLGFLIAHLLSNFITANNKFASFWEASLPILVLSAFYFFVLNNFPKKKLNLLLYALLSASFFLSWIAVFAFLGLFEKVPYQFLQSKVFTPTGSPLILISFLLIAFVIALIQGFKNKEALSKVLFFVLSSLNLLALILTVALILDKNLRPVLLPIPIGWSIAVDILKNAKTALFGVGPGNFVTAFTRFKPILFNKEEFWSANFATSSNEIFQIFTTLGLLGLFFFLWLTFSFLQSFSQTKRVIPKITLSLLLLIFFCLPANLLTWFLFYLFLAFLGILTAKEKLVIKKPKIITPLVLFFVIFSLGGLYLIGRLWLADFTFGKSLVTTSQNKGKETYDLQAKAISLNPYEENYHLAFARTNLALANSLASKKDLSDKEKETITTLVSQAIREAKNVVSLNREKASNWENLALVYRNLINFAQGADSWSISSYIQAIRLDSINPLLRLNLGGLFYAFGKFDEAINQFKKAIELKPDYANGYYNLAAAYKQKKDYLNAFYAMQNVLNLVEAETTDFDKATKELEELRSLLPSQPATAAAGKKEGELKAPQPLPSPRPEGPVKLPEEAQPPIPKESTPSGR